MAAPRFTPVSPIGAFRDGDTLPPAAAWTATRPAEVAGRQPSTALLGRPGPNQGYALALARRFHDRLALQDGEHEHDVIAGIVPVALKRASMYGRAPVSADVERALLLFGFLDSAPAPDLVAFRRSLFEAAGHHYEVQRAIADLVPDESLRAGTAVVATVLRSGRWRDLLKV